MLPLHTMAIVLSVKIVLLFPIVMHELNDTYVDHKDRVVIDGQLLDERHQYNHKNHHNTILYLNESINNKQ